MLHSLLDKFKHSIGKSHRKSVLKNSLLLVLCLLDEETVCLYKLSKVVPNILGNSSSRFYAHYKRFLRLFVAESEGDLWKLLISLGVGLFSSHIRYLVMDGTQWQLGKVKIHLLVLSVVYKGISIPVYWQNLEKKGISNIKERQKLLQEAKRLYHLTGKVLLADREYTGNKWFVWLAEQKIRFVIRLKRNTYKSRVNAGKGNSYQRMEKLCKNRKSCCSKTIEIQGVLFRFIVLKNRHSTPKEPCLYLLTSLENPKEAIEAYGQRWMIECCFKHLKSNGFHLEAINFKEVNRIRLMMALVIFAYCLCVHEGIKKLDEIPTKKYANGKVYLQKSVFRTGLDFWAIHNTEIVFILDYIIKNLNGIEYNFFSKKKLKFKNVQ